MANASRRNRQAYGIQAGHPTPSTGPNAAPDAAPSVAPSVAPDAAPSVTPNASPHGTANVAPTSALGIGPGIGQAPATPCARCATRGRTCCSTTPGAEAYCFPLSTEERQHIETCAPLSGGFVTQPTTEAFVTNIIKLFPLDAARIRQLFPVGGSHLRLALTPAGDCTFLGPQGCTLPRAARPYYCRVFPFWVMRGRLTLFTPPTCVVWLEARNVAPALELLGENAPDILALFANLRRSWGLSPLDGSPETL